MNSTGDLRQSVTTTAVTLLLVACQGGHKAGVAPSVDVSSGFQPATLPAQAADGTCNAQVEQPTLCDWAGRSEAVIFARIEGVAASRSPHVTSGSGSSELRDTACPGRASVALRLNLGVEDVLWGAVPTGSLTVAIGSNQVGEWNPIPVAGADGPVERWDGDNPIEPFQEGGTLLIGITRESSRGEWSLLGEALYAFDVFGKLIPVETECATEPAALLASPQFNALKSELAACPAERSDSAQKALASKKNWSKDPLVGLAALCFAPPAAN